MLNLLLVGLFSVPLKTITFPIIPVVEASSLSVPELMAIATSSAEKYHLNKKQTAVLLKVVDCESGWVATSTGALGERGLAQIYPKKHPEITESDMIDPYFALDFLAKNLYVHPTWWSCYRQVTS